MSWRQVSDTIVSKTRGRAFEEERHTNGVVTENVLDPHRLSMPRLQFSPTKCNVAEDTDPLMQVQLADGISIVEYGLYRRDLICTNWLPFQVGRAPVFKRLIIDGSRIVKQLSKNETPLTELMQNAMNPKRNGGEDWAEQTSLLANNTGAIKVVVTLFLSRSRRHGINLF